MEWCVSMPKVELHAHLNGSVRNSTLLLVFGDTPIYIFPFVSDDRSLHEVFKLFDFIHILTTDHSTITRITKEVIEDFASENVVYLELRTTPKRNDSIGMSKYPLALFTDDSAVLSTSLSREYGLAGCSLLIQSWKDRSVSAC